VKEEAREGERGRGGRGGRKEIGGREGGREGEGSALCPSVVSMNTTPDKGTFFFKALLSQALS
jgi:hypothetical protein